LAVTLYNLGSLLTKERKFDEALSAIHEGEAIYQKSGETTLYTFWGKFHLTRAYSAAGDYQHAIAEGLTSLDIGRKIKINESVDYINQLNTIGLAYKRSGKPREGEAYLRQAVEIAKAHLAPGEVVTPAMESALGECLVAQNKFAEAEPLLVQSFEKIKAIQGEKGVVTGYASKRLVELYEKLKKPELAAKYRPFVPPKP
jgi:tetratricopeptide (TPR) repeat protein